MANIPLVSVIVPAFNCETFIAEAIDSAIMQDYPNKEIIVIDDGSTDGTKEILESYGEKISLINQKNAGSAAARNTGINAAKGEFIAFLDSDDLWYPGKLTLQVDYFMRHPEVGLVYNNWIVWKPNSSNEYSLPKPPSIPNDRFALVNEKSGWMYNRLLMDCYVHTTAAVLRREIVEKVGLFDTGLRIGEDYDYWIRVSRITKISKLSAILSTYRTNPGSLTKHPNKINYAHIVIKRALDKWGRVGPDGCVTPRYQIYRRMSELWGGFAYLHYLSGDPWIAMHAYFNSLRYNPMQPKAWPMLLIVMLKSFRKLLKLY